MHVWFLRQIPLCFALLGLGQGCLSVEEVVHGWNSTRAVKNCERAHEPAACFAPEAFGMLKTMCPETRRLNYDFDVVSIGSAFFVVHCVWVVAEMEVGFYP